MIDLESLKETIQDLAINYGLKFIYALLVFFIGLWLVNKVTKGLTRLMDKKEMDASLKPFLKTLLSILLKALLGITVLIMLGVEMTSFVALLGAAGLAIGMALSGTLQNFAGGVMILIFKPFKVGDYIEAQGHAGSVDEIQIFNTYLKTPDNKVIIIPNGALSNSSMVNYSRMETRRVDFIFGIGYNDDIDKAKSIITRIVSDHELVLKDPEPLVAVSELAESSVNLVVRIWVKTPDYWTVFFFIQEKVKKEFAKEGVSIPFPQRDIHVFQNNKN